MGSGMASLLTIYLADNSVNDERAYLMIERKKIPMTTLVALLAIVGVGTSCQIVNEPAVSESQAAETVIIQRGDLSMTLDAAGSLVSPTEFTLAFPVAGRLDEIDIVEGQAVEQGDVLARLDTNGQAEADFQALFSDAGILQSELALLHSRDALTDAVDDLAYLIGLDAYYWEGQLAQAEELLGSLADDPNATNGQKIDAQKRVDDARGWRDYYREVNIKKLEKEYKVFKTIRMRGQTRRIYLYTVYYKVDTELLLAYANWESAKVALQDAQAALEIVKSGPTALLSPLPALGPEMAQLEQTRLNLENSRLIALTDGVVTKVNLPSGGYVAPGAPVVIVSDLTSLDVTVNLDETDIHRIRLGMPVVISVDALPGKSLSGQVTEIASSANVHSGVALYPVTIKLDAADLHLRAGMTVSVTFLIEERTSTLLVPSRAIETEGGQAYATRVTASGSERVAVLLGLITDTHVEILGGLEEGDVVRVYDNPVQETGVMSNPMFGAGQ